jgi:hypothetical protein
VVEWGIGDQKERSPYFNICQFALKALLWGYDKMKAKYTIWMLLWSILIIFLPNCRILGCGTPPTHDKDISGEFEIEQEFAFIEFDNGIQTTRLLLYLPGIFGDSQPVFVFPVDAPISEIDVSFEEVELKCGADVRWVANSLLYNHFVLGYSSQLFTIPIFWIDEFHMSSRHYDRIAIQKAENEMQFEQGLRIPSTEEQIQRSGISADLLSSNQMEEIDGLEIHKMIKEEGLAIYVVEDRDMQVFLEGLESRGIELGAEFKEVIAEYSNRGFSFVIYGVVEPLKFARLNPLLYTLFLLNQRRRFEIMDFLKTYTNEELQELKIDLDEEDIGAFLKWCIMDDEYYLKATENARYLLFRNGGDIPGIRISYPCDRIQFPLKMKSIYGESDIAISIYVNNHTSPIIPAAIKPFSEVRYFFSYFGNPWFTKIKLLPPSKLITDDVFIVNSAPLSAIFARIIWPSNGKLLFRSDYAWILIHLTVFILLCILPISILSSYITSLLIFRKSHVRRWRFAILGIFNFFSIIGVIIAILLMRTRRTKKGGGEMAYTRKDLRKLWFVILFSFFFLVITAIIHLILNAMLL